MTIAKPRWTEEEVQLLKNNAGNMSASAIGKLVGKSSGSVWSKARRLGISLDGYCKKIKCAGCDTMISVSWQANVDTLCPICRERTRKKSWHLNSLRRYNEAFDGNKTGALERDGYKCRLCGGTKKLIIHHIDGRSYHNCDNPNNDLDNLTTLCGACHTIYHASVRRHRKRVM
jgi:hypothetical protein